jgi:argininosuccinate synthase
VTRKGRIVFAYTGEPDQSSAIPRLAEEHRAEVVALTMDVGQGRELDQVRERALASGAIRAHVLDVREEFARHYILPALQAGALYAGRYPMTSSLARPLIASKLVEIARIENATAVAHGARGRGNDLLPLDVSLRALEPTIQIFTPGRSAGPAAVAGPYHVDANLWGRSVEYGILDDPWQEAPEEVYALTRAAAGSPAAAAYVEISFDRGVPAAINGVTMSFTELVESLTTIAGSHGVGRMDTIEKRQAEVMSREISEAPAAVVLHAAHRELETFVLARDLARLKRELSLKYADLVYNGLWFTPMREALDAFTRKVQELVTGTIRVKLFKGNCEVVGRRAATAVSDPPPGSDAPTSASSSAFVAPRS